MKKLSFISLILLVLSVSCSQPGSSEQSETPNEQVFKSETHQQFFDNLAKLCGQKFVGAETFTIEGRENWQDKKLVMEVVLCESDKLHVTLAVDEDRSRTWMFLEEEGALRFRHDHRHADGTPDEVTLYGGYATNAGDALVQYFPADEYTCQLIDYACKNEWVVMLNKEKTLFSYILSLDGVMRFQADFDLTRPL
jgi:hypothetical protein